MVKQKEMAEVVRASGIELSALQKVAVRRALNGNRLALVEGSALQWAYGSALKALGKVQ